MAGTIQQIADLAGVSRGTVDRALNGRGRINPEVAKRILDIAEEIGYVPKHIVRGAGKKKHMKMGVITQLASSGFMSEVNRGIEQAKEILAERNIEIILKPSESVNEEEQLKAIEELKKQGMDGLAIMPVECEGVRTAVNQLIDEENKPVVTFNSDIIGTKRSCFVGMDNKKSGRTAAGLMNILTAGKGKILVITGYFSNHVNNARVDGFIEEIKQSFPEMEVIGVQGSFDQASEVEKIIVNTMTSFPTLDGIYVASGGQKGISKAFEKMKRKEKRPSVIIYDLTPNNIRALQENTVDFLIDQEGYEQGYRSLMMLADIMQKNVEVGCDSLYTDINIKTKYNL